MLETGVYTASEQVDIDNKVTAEKCEKAYNHGVRDAEKKNWRYEFAKAAMQGQLSCENLYNSPENIASEAVVFADALLAALEKGKRGCTTP